MNSYKHVYFRWNTLHKVAVCRIGFSLYLP